MVRRFAAALIALAAIAGVATRATAGYERAAIVSPASIAIPSASLSRSPDLSERSDLADQPDPPATPAIAEALAPLTRPISVATLDDATRGTAEQVGTTLPDPNPLPASSGSGRRAVFSISQQFVWAVESDGTLAHSFLVSARLDMPRPGTYHVFSRSEFTCARSNWNECMRWMVRFTKGPGGDNIGFHEIPRIKGVPVQSDAQLGQPLSSGCLRESTEDAWFMWLWAPIGTTVVVVP